MYPFLPEPWLSRLSRLSSAVEVLSSVCRGCCRGSVKLTLCVCDVEVSRLLSSVEAVEAVEAAQGLSSVEDVLCVECVL